MKNTLLTGTLFILLSGITFSQDIFDALRYSENYYSGSSRFMSMAGSMGALGGDLSAITVNPAGVGVYRNGEFSFTPEFRMYNYETSAYDGISSDFDYGFKLNQIGLVTGYTRNSDEGLVSLNFGVTYNNLADFNDQRNTSVIEWPDTRLVDMVIRANENDPTGMNPGRLNEFFEGLAYETFLINYDTTAMEYWSHPSDNYFNEDELRQDIHTTLNTTGYLGEYTLAVGGNYEHKLYFGGSIGIQVLRYNEDRNHYEEDYVDVTDDFHSMEYIENINTDGTGVNAKLGIIYRPVQFVRLGLAVHTPTIFSVENSYTADLYADFDNGDQLDAASSERITEYNLKTPLRLNTSVGLQFKEYGLLNIDYEYVDYSNINLSSGSAGFSMDDLNTDISNTFKPAHNIRTGLEGRLGSVALRAGYAFYMSNEKTNLNKDNHKSIASVGMGFRSKQMYFDLGYANLVTGYKDLFFQIDEVDYERQMGRLMATVGFRF